MSLVPIPNRLHAQKQLHRNKNNYILLIAIKNGCRWPVRFHRLLYLSNPTLWLGVNTHGYLTFRYSQTQLRISPTKKRAGRITCLAGAGSFVPVFLLPGAISSGLGRIDGRPCSSFIPTSRRFCVGPDSYPIRLGCYSLHLVRYSIALSKSFPSIRFRALALLTSGTPPSDSIIIKKYHFA